MLFYSLYSNDNCFKVTHFNVIYGEKCRGESCLPTHTPWLAQPVACSTRRLPHTVSWALSHQSLVKKISHMLAHRPIWWFPLLFQQVLSPRPTTTGKVVSAQTTLACVRQHKRKQHTEAVAKTPLFYTHVRRNRAVCHTLSMSLPLVHPSALRS